VSAGGTMALAQPASQTLAGFLILGAAVWIGGLVAIFVVARVAQRTLPPAQRVAFFRGLGRAYGPVGGLALASAIGCGAALLYGHAWDGTLIAAIVVTVCLVWVTAAGVVQARRMTRLRQAALRQHRGEAGAPYLRRAALRAAGLRIVIAVLSLALIALGVLLAS
jgi:hypothetical protein